MKTMESWFLDGKKSNSAKMVLINILGNSPPDRHTIVRAKIRGKNPFFSLNPIKMRLLGYLGMQNSFLR